MTRLADYLPMGYAFGAGMVSTVNPCGFAMLRPTFRFTWAPRTASFISGPKSTQQNLLAHMSRFARVVRPHLQIVERDDPGWFSSRMV